MSTADDVHAKLVRALEQAQRETIPGGAERAHRVLGELVQPLALASIALELRNLRLTIEDIPQSVHGLRVDVSQ